MLILPSPVLLLLLCCCSKSGISRKVSRQVKAPPPAPPHFYLRGHGHSNEAWLCAATPPEIVGRRTMDRHGIRVRRKWKSGNLSEEKGEEEGQEGGFWKVSNETCPRAVFYLPLHKKITLAEPLSGDETVPSWEQPGLSSFWSMSRPGYGNSDIFDHTSLKSGATSSCSSCEE